MSREILFRGQTCRPGDKVNMNGEKLPGEWVYGGVFIGTGDYSVIYGGETEDQMEKFVVHTETVGQWTGLTDGNGERIFSGDLIFGNAKVFLVKYVLSDARFEAFSLDGTYLSYIDSDMMKRFDVIGNIHDSPSFSDVMKLINPKYGMDVNELNKKHNR